MIILKNWYILSMFDYRDPSVYGYVLCGDVYGNEKFKDGSNVRTSMIEEIVDCGDYKKAITHSGTHYCLFKEYMSSEYEKNYPNAYEKLRLKRE